MSYASNGQFSPVPRSLHIVMHPKGGVGKTFVARVLAEYLGVPALDADCFNRSLSRFAGHLNVA